MGRLRPGSFLWLLAHEMRLGWRGGFMLRAGSRRPKAGLVITVLFVLGVGVFGGVPIGLALRGHSLAQFPMFVPIADMALLAAFTLMLSQTIIGAVQILYERGDFDLLLSSPVSAARVLAVRALAMAFNACTIFAVLLTPMIVPIAVLSHPAWLASYAVILALALTASALGLALSIGLFAIIGPRRTKVVGQVLGAIIGAGFFLVAQARSILGAGRSASLWRDLIASSSEGRLHLSGVATWPARAMLGEPLPVLGVVGGAAMIFIVTVWALGRRFAGDAAAATGADAPRARRASGAPARFRSGAFRATVTKELRLLLRDPGLISQVLLRVLYMVPLVFLVLHNAHARQAMAIASGVGGVVFMAGQIAGSLSWITVSAEDAPELIAASPAKLWTIWRGKVAGALLPLAVLMAAPLAALVWIAPWAGVVAAAGCVAASISTAAINIWMQKPGKRTEFRRRRDSALIATIAELVVGLLWGAAAGLAVAGQLWAAIPLALAIAVTAALRRSEASVMRRLSEATA
jgi:ABC-2 type transport system permease protein